MVLARLGTLAVLLAGIWTLPVAALAADEGHRRAPEIGIQGGFFLPDKDLTGKPEVFDQIEPVGGLRGGYLFAGHAGWFIDATFSDINTNVGAEDADLFTGRTGVELFLTPHWNKKQFFFSVGGGWMDFQLESGTSFDRTFASLGFGQRITLDERARVRWELRADRTLDDEGLGGRDLTHPKFMLGLTWLLGNVRRDTDGDGVRDSRDRCPDTPRGATVDEHGCPSDSDKDGVYDGIDQCPDTPRGATVDARGCPRDTDGDGVFDGIDQCPDTPRGATVDARGCPRDSDGDGVFDGIDQCPDTPRGATVDARGCPRDSDGDGVFDGIDQCPDTPRGATVDARGCPRDSDGDGVFDGIDQCPDTPRGTPVNPDGCPRAAPLFRNERTNLILEGVYFDLNRATLTPGSRSVLDRVAASLRDWPDVRVQIAGHTDSTGTDAYNESLSRRRAESVRAYLASKEVDPSRLEARGYGESTPIDDNRTRQGRARNRRVELNRLD